MFANALKQSLRSSTIASRSMNLAMAKSASVRLFSQYKSVRAAIDGNEAAADSAYNVSDAAILYPISPSSAMGEHADAWAVKGRKNIFGNTLRVTEMQSEGGAAGALHGALVGGLLGTTFTASQGMMLMIPNMYRIAGGLLPAVIHVASRVVSKQALSLLCEHSDVMATRQTGFAILSSHCVQEAHDLALVAHLSAITSSVPFLHFFDGWRVSHEVNSISKIPCEAVAKIYPYEDANIFRKRALNPNHPYQRGIAQSQDIYMQNCVVAQPFYDACPDKVQAAMDKVASITGRQYHLFDYAGAPDADRVIVIMGASASTVEETVNYLNQHGEKVGVMKVHLWRPFSLKHFAAALPKTVKKICVLTGAGISCNAGIPDFRSPVTGIYNNLQEYNLPTPEAMFELEFFRKNPSVFYRFLHVGLDPLHSRHRHFFPERTNRRIRTTSSSCWRRKVCYCVYIRRTSTDWSVSRD